MARSPGFGSSLRYHVALFRLAFTVASFPQELNQATQDSLVGSFFNRNAVTDCSAPTPCKHTVSDTLSSPSRAAFQLSITVLVHYRSEEVFSLATSSWLLPTGFLEPRRTLDQKHMREKQFRLPDYHRLWFRFPADSTIVFLSHAGPLGNRRFVRNMMCATAQARHLCPRSNLRPTRCRGSHISFRLVRFRSPLLTESCRHHVSERLE